MGNKIDKVVGGVYLGDISGARDEEGMKALGITHVLSLRLKEEEIHPGQFKYLCIEAPNFPDSDISKHFKQCIGMRCYSFILLAVFPEDRISAYFTRLVNLIMSLII